MVGLGMWNPRQYLQQSVQIFNAAGIAGWGKAGKAFFGGNLMRRALRDPNTAKWARSQKKMHGLDPHEFDEMVRAYDEVGFHVVGNSTVYTEDLLNIRTVKTKLGRYTNPLVFFERGEQFNRSTAFHMALQRWLEKPGNNLRGGRKLNSREIGEITGDANVLSGDMLASSKATWQRGLAGVPTQYWSFNARMLDMYWGRKLSNREKMGLFMANAITWGYPAGIGSALGVVNVKDVVDEGGIANSEDVDRRKNGPDNLDFGEISKNGGFTMLSRWVTGADVNVGESIGTDGLNLANQLTDDLNAGEFSLFDYALGASGKTTESGIRVFETFTAGILGLAAGENRILWGDVSDVLRSLTGYSNAEKAWMVLNTQEYQDRFGRNLATDLSTVDALWQLYGIHNFQVDDFYDRNRVAKREGKLKQQILRDISDIGEKLNADSSPAELAELTRRANALAVAGRIEPRDFYKAFRKTTKHRKAYDEIIFRHRNDSPEAHEAFFKNIGLDKPEGTR